ncbi:Uncharacterised protein [uncultured archaeon]|nr:Uncharacterised protein [uncultured archaeon]
MTEGPIFQIGSQQASRDIYNIARDLNISQNSSREDMTKVIEAIRYKISESNLEEKSKEKIDNHLDNVTIKLKDKNPDKESIADSIKQTNEILKEAKTTGESLKDIGALIAKAALWLGTTAAKLGWIF